MMIACPLSREDERGTELFVEKTLSKEALSIFLREGNPSRPPLHYRRRLEFLAPLTIYPAEAHVKTSLLDPRPLSYIISHFREIQLFNYLQDFSGYTERYLYVAERYRLGVSCHSERRNRSRRNYSEIKFSTVSDIVSSGFA